MIEIIEIIVVGAYALLFCLGLVRVGVVGAWCALMCLVDANNRIINLILAIIGFVIVSYAVGLRIV
jgi:hypothetical protein